MATKRFVNNEDFDTEFADSEEELEDPELGELGESKKPLYRKDSEEEFEELNLEEDAMGESESDVEEL
ncbi:MAG: hypothetical protein A2583_07750 [Bdellovibrionales bacterium RIFOXYD1_FULL_53_11]|nr:MAG: hypothetical protein A2583_07750 [Bdellovibrionales bacterium RIFOXYD1_FULL_53_11]